MNGGWDAQGPAARVDAALRRSATSVDRVAPARWLVGWGAAERLEARVEDEWLALEAKAAPGEGAAWALLCGSVAVPPPWRLAEAADGSLRRRAELLLDADVDVAVALAAALSAAAAVAAPEAGAPNTARAAAAAGLGDLCAAAGWRAQPRPDGTHAVDLDVPGLYLPANLGVDARGWSAAVPLAGAAASSDASREASARLLLRVAGLFRLVRAAAVAADSLVVSFAAGPDAAERSIAVPGLQVRGAGAPSGADLGHAFAALSLACRQCAREAAILWGDERVARLYLSPPRGRARRESFNRGAAGGAASTEEEPWQRQQP